MGRTSKRETAARALPYADALRLKMRCQRCRAEPGERCKNYKGQNKAMCPDRGLALKAAAPLRKTEPEPALYRPMVQGTLADYLPPAGPEGAP